MAENVAVTEKITENAKEAVAKVGETLSVATENLKDNVTSFTGRFGTTILIGIVVAAVLFMGAYILYTYLSSRLTNKLVVMVPDSKIPRKGTELTRLDGTAFPPSSNGNRSTFMFWIYIHDISKFSGDEMRHVLHRGEESTLGASPIVYLDGKANRMYVRFDKLQGDPTDFAGNVSAIMDDAISAESMYYNRVAAGNQLDAIKVDLSSRGIIIDYIPLQRWVHVAVVVNETVNKGYISAYLDGELVKTISSSDKIELSNGTGEYVVLQDLNLNKKGDIYIGGNLYNDNISRGFSGLVSKVTFANFDMNGREVREQYVTGPIDNLSSKLGLPAYGLRSPVYRIG